jgi:hypothetical protein
MWLLWAGVEREPSSMIPLTGGENLSPRLPFCSPRVLQGVSVEELLLPQEPWLPALPTVCSSVLLSMCVLVLRQISALSEVTATRVRLVRSVLTEALVVTGPDWSCTRVCVYSLVLRLCWCISPELCPEPLS